MLSPISGTIGNSVLTVVVDPADGTAYKHQIASFTPISGSTLEMSDMLVCRLYRKATDISDNYNAAAGGLEIDIHYEIDTLGSSEQYTK